MELLGSAALVLVAVALFEVAAVVFGSDSREHIGDDHQRQLEGGA